MVLGTTLGGRYFSGRGWFVGERPVLKAELICATQCPLFSLLPHSALRSASVRRPPSSLGTADVVWRVLAQIPA